MPNFYSPKGNIEVWGEKPEGYFTVEEWDEMHPPVIPEKTTEEKLNELDATYTYEKKELIEAYNDAMVHDDSEAANEIKAEIAALDEQYDEDYQKIKDEEDNTEVER